MPLILMVPAGDAPQPAAVPSNASRGGDRPPGLPVRTVDMCDPAASARSPPASVRLSSCLWEGRTRPQSRSGGAPYAALCVSRFSAAER